MKSNKKTGLVVGIILIVLLCIALAGGAAAYYFCFRPIVKVNRAIEEEDYQKVSDLFGELKEEEKEEVAEKMLDLANDLKRDYEKDKIDYDEVMDIYDVLEENILEDSDDLETNIEKIEALKESREAYDAGKKAMDKEEYLVAIEEFGKVIKKDSNYDSAQELIAECQELLPADVVGNWVCNFDMGQTIGTMIGASSSVIPEITIPIYLDFNEDNTGILHIDMEDIQNSLDSVIDFAIPFLVKQYSEEYGLTEKELDSMLKMVYGKSMRDYIKDEVKKSLADSTSVTDATFVYEVTADGITAKDAMGAEILFELDGDKLSMSTDDANVITAFEEYGMKMPLEFERIK